MLAVTVECAMEMMSPLDYSGFQSNFLTLMLHNQVIPGWKDLLLFFRGNDQESD